MFFKKQAFKIKDLLKEKGVELPLVTVQEILAKSYGFNNRHVILSNDNFIGKLDSLSFKEEDVEKKKIDNNSSRYFINYPYELTEENIKNYSFLWSTRDKNNLHNENPFDYGFKNGDVFFIYNEKISNPTLLSYVYDSRYENNSFYRRDILKSFAELNGGKHTFKSFNEINIKKEDFENLMYFVKDWDSIKKLLLHKDCPIEYLKKYTTHHEWYIRLTAIFGKHHRDKLYSLAKKDKDARVRKVYYTYLLQNEVKSIDEIRKELKEDDLKVKNLLKHIKYLVDEEKDEWKYLVNW